MFILKFLQFTCQFIFLNELFHFSIKDFPPYKVQFILTKVLNYVQCHIFNLLKYYFNFLILFFLFLMLHSFHSIFNLKSIYQVFVILRIK